ncbi:hypothetical protein C8R44DRAFT_814975 [Mycena epipterygia]|nr:hypothetical protein C8R44DRAFT_814975 [Mycena epipterygia]
MTFIHLSRAVPYLAACGIDSVRAASHFEPLVALHLSCAVCTYCRLWLLYRSMGNAALKSSDIDGSMMGQRV